MRHSFTVVSAHLGRLVLDLHDIQLAVELPNGELGAVSADVRPPLSSNPREEWCFVDDTLQLRDHAVVVSRGAGSLKVVGLIYVGQGGLVLAQQRLDFPTLLNPGDSLAAALVVVMAQE